MSTVHSNQMSLTPNFSFCDLGLTDKSNCKRNASFFLNCQKSTHKCNQLCRNGKHIEHLQSKINCQKVLLSSRIPLKTDDSRRLRKAVSKQSAESTFLPVPPSDTGNGHFMVPSPSWNPKQELPFLNDTIKVKTEVETVSSSITTAGFTVETGTSSVKQEPPNSLENNQTMSNAPQDTQGGKPSLFNFAKPKNEISKPVVAKDEQVSSFSVPATGEEATMLISEEIKAEKDINASDISNMKNEDFGQCNVKSNPKVGNDSSPDRRKIKTTRSETDKMKQLKLRKERFTKNNKSGFPNQNGDTHTSTGVVKRKIVFSCEGDKCLTKGNTIPGDNLNRLRILLNNTPGDSDRIKNTKFTSSGGSSSGGGKPWFSYEEANFARRNRFDGTRRNILKAKRWSKRIQKPSKKMDISVCSIPEKICHNWGVATSSDKHINLSVASYIRCRLSKFQLQTFRGRLEGEKISTLANVGPGQKRRLSIDDESLSQRVKRCRLTYDGDQDYDEKDEETSILDFKKNSIAKLEALEKEWNEKIDLEIDAISINYKHDLRQLQEQQSLENYSLCLKHSNQIYNGTIENLARKHWKAFRQMQNNFLLKMQYIEKKRHMRLAGLRKEFQEAALHIQTILNSNEVLSDDIECQKVQNSTCTSRRISVGTAVTLVKEDKIYDSFYTQ